MQAYVSVSFALPTMGDRGLRILELMQVVRELKRAGYKPRMAILVSPSAALPHMKAARNIAQAHIQGAVADGAHRIDMPARG